MSAVAVGLNETDMVGTSATVTVALLLGSATLLAVMVMLC